MSFAYFQNHRFEVANQDILEVGCQACMLSCFCQSNVTADWLSEQTEWHLAGVFFKRDKYKCIGVDNGQIDSVTSYQSKRQKKYTIKY